MSEGSTYETYLQNILKEPSCIRDLENSPGLVCVVFQYGREILAELEKRNSPWASTFRTKIGEIARRTSKVVGLLENDEIRNDFRHTSDLLSAFFKHGNAIIQELEKRNWYISDFLRGMRPGWVAQDPKAIKPVSEYIISGNQWFH